MTEPFISANKSFYTIKNWHDHVPGLVAGFTVKYGGCSSGDFPSLNTGFHVKDRMEDVIANRRLIGDMLDFSTNCWVAAEQTHGTNIACVHKQDAGKGALSYEEGFRDTDGFYTDERGVLLTLGFADCVPLYFFDPVTKRIGAAHAGWKGTVAGIGAKMIKHWEENGISPKTVEVAIGPSICRNCYIVDDRVIKEAARWLDGESIIPYCAVDGQIGQYHLSLQELNKIILEKAGVTKNNIYMTNYCTSCNEEFFSHRRDQGKTGRMMSFIGWKEDAQS